ncbi:MAG: U32 family peptidase [Clostridiales bacterium]|nr:U32 family peptidase [Clostridiales bacterium]
MELLAPAGNEQALQAAIKAGADAVYLGYTDFGARAAIHNFTKEELTQAVRLCHVYHKKVYVTLNTLIKEKEMEQVEEVTAFLSALPVDGIIVQDIGLATHIQKKHPQIPLHASTQMAIHTLQGAKFLQDAGFARVVLARECTMKTIEAVAKTGIETEVFVHGALCVSQSGQCLFSGMVGGRSGNRGRCAQACRLPYQYQGQWGNWLSPKDINTRDRLDDLYRAGVHSLKIEGRAKRPEYVGGITASYRIGVDSLLEGKFQQAQREEKKGNAQLFNRGGFTLGYAFDKEDREVIDPKWVNHRGLPVGEVVKVEKNFVYIALEEDLHDGDGLRFIGKEERETTYSGPFVEKGERAKVRLRDDIQVSPFTRVMRLWDAKQLQQIHETPDKKIMVTGQMKAQVGKPAQVIFSDGTHMGQATGPPVEKAQKAAFTQEDAQRLLAKLKQTPYELGEVTLWGEEGFLPASLVNELRKKAVENLTCQRIKAFEQDNKKTYAAPYVLHKEEKDGRNMPAILVKSANPLLGKTVTQVGGCVFLYSPRDFRLQNLKKDLSQLPEGSWLALPTQLSSATLEEVGKLLQTTGLPLQGVALGNIGQLGQDFSAPIALLEGIPLWNQSALKALRKYGSCWEVASPELNAKELTAVQGEGKPLVQPVYGRHRLMTLNHCPARTFLGLGKGREGCRLCEERKEESLLGKSLTDRKGYEFPLLAVHQQEGCVVELYNSLPLNLFDTMNQQFPQRSILLDFTVESLEEQRRIFAAFTEKRQKNLGENPVDIGTQGHFFRGVE